MWETSTLLKGGETHEYSIIALADTGGNVTETDEINNQLTTTVEIIGVARATSSFGMTFLLMALGVALTSGISVYARRKKRE